MKKSFLVFLISCSLTSCAQLGMGTSVHNAWVKLDRLLSYSSQDVANYKNVHKKEVGEELIDLAEIIYKDGKCLDLEEKEIDVDICLSVKKIAANFTLFRSELDEISNMRNEIEAEQYGQDSQEKFNKKSVALNKLQSSLNEFLRKYQLSKILESKNKYLPVFVSGLGGALKLEKIAGIRAQLKENLSQSKKYEDELGKKMLSPEKRRAANPARWKECRETYLKYINVVRGKIKVNRRISTEELLKISEDLKPSQENLVVCQVEGFYDELQSGNVMGGAYCLNFYNATPSTAKSTSECKDIMKADSF